MQAQFRVLRSIALLSLPLAAVSVRALAQDTRGAVSGRITDSRGAVVADAAVTLTNDATQVATTFKSNKSGDFTFTELNPGRYTLSITAPGFSTFRESGIQVDVAGNAQMNPVLKIGSASEAVTVQANAQQLQTSNPNLGMVIEEKAMTDLPLIYGNPFALAELAPGVTLSGVNPNIHVYDSSTTNVSVNGSAYNSLDYKLDGAADNRIRVSAFTPNTESISQYRVATTSLDATQGHASGGFVNVQTKSGTDQFHGSVFGYYQNAAINANVWLLNSSVAQTKPGFQRYGGTIGGPVLKQKLFFFAGFEKSRQDNPTVNTYTIPSQAQIAGDFSAALALDTDPTHARCTTPGIITGTPNNYQIFDARSVTYTNGRYYRTCIPNNNLAAYTKIDPVAQKLLSYYPAANGGTAAAPTYSFAYTLPDNYAGGITRLDYAINERQSMYAHLLRSERYNNGGNYFGDVSGTHLDYSNWGVALGHTIALSSSTVITTSLGYTRFVNQNTNMAQGTVSPTSIGMPSYLTTGLPDSAQALPRLDLTGYTSVNTSSATLGRDDIWLGNVTASRQVRSHFIRFGGEYRRYITGGMSGQTENGSYSSSGALASQYNGATLAGAGAVLSIAQAEQGLVNSGSQTQNSDFLTRSDYWTGFFQDDWRVTPKLTLNLGLRWEMERPMRELNGKEIVAFDFNATNSATVAGAANYASKVAGKVGFLPATITPTGGAVFANTQGYGADPYNAPRNDYSPRIGLAYAVNQKTVVRAGYGIFYDNLVLYYLSGGNGGSTTTFLVPQQGYSQTTSITAPVYSNNGTTGSVAITSTLDNPFPSGLLPVTGNKAGYNTALGQDIQFLQPNPHMPYNQRFNVGVQRQIGQFIVSVDYVGNKGSHLPTGQISTGTNYGGQDFNAIPNQYLSTVTNGYDQAEANAVSGSTVTVTNPFYGLIPSGASNGLSSSTIAPIQLTRPRPEFGRINSFTMNGMSIYHSVQVQAQRRFTGGFSMTGAFTWSRSLDGTQYLNPGDGSPWYGVSQTDRPLRFSGSAIYQLPWGRGRHWLSSSHGPLSQIVGGWQVQGVYQIQSGAPLNFTGNDIYYGTNPGDSHWSRGQYAATQQFTPSRRGGFWFDPTNWLTSTSTIPSKNHTSSCATTTQAFCANVFPGTYQIRRFAPRYNTLRADNLNQLDIGLQRQFQIWKLGVLQFRGEAINILNHPVYSAPSTDPTNALFGQIVSQANQPRVFQFAGFFRF